MCQECKCHDRKDDSLIIAPLRGCAITGPFGIVYKRQHLIIH